MSPFTDESSFTLSPSSMVGFSSPSVSGSPHSPQMEKPNLTKILKKNIKTKTTKLARSRFGCESCKLKRVKCDETRPSCNRCQGAGIKCNYKMVLQFKEDLERKGKKFGREGVWSLKNKSNDTTMDLMIKSKSSYYMTIRRAHELEFINFGYRDLAHSNQIHLSPSLQPSIFPHDIVNCYSYDHPSLNFALSYYIDFIAPIFNPIMDTSSHYIEEVILHGTHLRIEKGLNLTSLIQYSQNHHHLFYLILSLGSVYISKYQNDNIRWVSQSQEFQKLGISQIKNKLAQIEIEQDPEVSTDIMLALVLLIMYEIADDCNRTWSAYLSICKKLKSSSKFANPTSNLEASLLNFAMEFLYYQESMGRTACKDKNSFFMIMEDVDQQQQLKPDRVISWMGCQRGLIDAISDITDLSFERTNQGMNERNYTILCDSIMQRLKSMELNIDIDSAFCDIGVIDSNGTIVDVGHSELIIIDPALDIEQFCFILSCEIKTFVAEIYLDCCLLNKSPHDLNVQLQIKKICKMLKYIVLKNDFKWCSTLLWAIFIVGVEISNQDEDAEELRYLVLQLLNKLETYSLGNVNAVRGVITNVWKRRDLKDDGSDIHGTGGVTGFTNDWERYVSDKSLKISLA